MFLILLVYLTCANSNSNSVLTSIGRRFQRIIDFVPPDHSVADIGGDHGQITALLTEHLNEDCSITYIDKSQISYEKARSYLTSYCLDNRIQMHNGDGLAPLLESQLTCDTLILAGMGSSTVGNIIRSNSSTSGNVQSLIDIKVKQLVIQPWPINILPMLTLLQLLLSHGWSIDKQGIDEVGDYMYITTSLLSPTVSHTTVTNCIPPPTNNNHIHTDKLIDSRTTITSVITSPKVLSLGYSSVFRSWPLYQRHSLPPPTATATTTSEEEGANITVKNDSVSDENIEEECILWRKYLIKQSKTLIRKSNYIIEKGHNYEGSQEYEVCELTRLIQDQLKLYADSNNSYSKLN